MCMSGPSPSPNLHIQSSELGTEFDPIDYKSSLNLLRRCLKTGQHVFMTK